MILRFVIAAAIASTCVSTAYAELRISGVDDELADNIRSYVGLSKEECTADAGRIERRFARIEAEVHAALEPFGYYDPRADARLSFEDDCWHAAINVEPGRPVIWRDVDVRIDGAAEDDEEFGRLIATSSFKRGDVLRHADYERLKTLLQNKAAERGFVEAAFTTRRLDVWPEEFAADATLHFASGPRYAFGEIDYETPVLERRLLDAYTGLTPGDAYDSDDIARAYRDLSASGYFRRVDVLPDFDAAAERRIPVRIGLTPAERIEYTVGAGFATDTGPRFRGGYRNRRVNKRGHRFSADLTVSPVISGLTADYRQPLGDPRSDWMSYTAAIDVEDTDTAESEAIRAGLRRTRRVGANWLRTLSLDLSYDRFTVAEITDRSRLVLPAIAYEYKRADRELYPDRGVRLNFEVRGTHQALGSNTDLLQFVARGRWIRATSDNGRLLARAVVGVTAKDDFSELPPSLRFFAGGDESVRGFDYNTLGPTNDDGDVVGGSALLVASIEYEHRIKGNFFAAAFVDGGNAYDGDEFDPAYGTGLGVKWRSPVGPIRLYLAHPLNQSNSDVRAHISLGVDL